MGQGYWLKSLQNIKDSIKAVDEQIANICIEFPEYHRLLTIPGFGPDISSKILGAIGKPPSGLIMVKQLLKLAGFDLNAKRSGKNL